MPPIKKIKERGTPISPAPELEQTEDGAPDGPAIIPEDKSTPQVLSPEAEALLTAGHPQLESPEDEFPKVETPESPIASPKDGSQDSTEDKKDKVVTLEFTGDSQSVLKAQREIAEEASQEASKLVAIVPAKPDYGFGVGHPVDSSAPVRDEVWR
jgi:hypothetical protein